MKKIFTITIYILAILIPALLIFNLRIENQNVELSDHKEQEQIIELADSVIIKIEEVKKKELELTSKIESTEKLITNQNKEIKQLKETKPEIIEVVQESMAYEMVAYELPQPEIVMVEVETINYDVQDSLIIEIEKLKRENLLLKDTLSTLRETNIWKRAIKKIEKVNSL
jgi:hypothetical protein